MRTNESLAQAIAAALAPDVRIIESLEKGKNRLTKVAAYCRVSTKLDAQQKSLENQMDVFRRTISEHPGWVLADIYADRGISGTSVKNREEFLRMIEDAKAGKIQYILVKSVSRFSRNTVDVLEYVRELKKHGVAVYFENEKLDTGTAMSEFILSILAASAQEQIMSLSNNIKVGKRMRYATGKVDWTKAYGYRKGEGDAWVVEENEAQIVRRVFDEYTSGKSLMEICRGLEDDGIPALAGKEHWYPTSLSFILHNERYTGDLRAQKSCVIDPIEHTRINNREAKIRQYYIENHHPAIIDKEAFEIARTVSTMRDMHRGCVQYPLYGFLKCPYCGQNMVRFNHPRRHNVYTWTCGGKSSKKGQKRKHRTTCPPYILLESSIHSAFRQALLSVSRDELKGIAEGSGKNAALSNAMLRLRYKALTSEIKIEYKTLYDLVERITFPTWSEMQIDWKIGKISKAPLEYGKLSDEPLPDLRGTNGTVPRKNQVQSILLAQNAVKELTILEPRSYEADIPMVFTNKTTKAVQSKTKV